MEHQRLKINCVLSLSQMKQVSGSCQVLLDRDDVNRFERQRRRRSIPNPLTEAVEPAQCNEMAERDVHLEESSSVRRTSRTPSPGPSCSTAAPVGLLEGTYINQRVREDDSRLRKRAPTKETVVKQFRSRNKMHSGRHSCLFCEKECPCWSDLEVHMRVHTDERPFTCLLCQATFRTPDGLKFHKLAVHSREEKKFACGHCGKRFLFKGSLKTHEMIHSSERLFPFNLCEKSFRRKDHLETHLRFHTGERPFKCELCQKRFFMTNHLKRHQFTHGPVTLRPYKCTMCPKAFCDKTKLTNHVNLHTGKKPYKCQMCQKAFPSAHSLRTHRQSNCHRPADSKSCGVQPSA